MSRTPLYLSVIVSISSLCAALAFAYSQGTVGWALALASTTAAAACAWLIFQEIHRVLRLAQASAKATGCQLDTSLDATFSGLLDCLEAVRKEAAEMSGEVKFTRQQAETAVSEARQAARLAEESRIENMRAAADKLLAITKRVQDSSMHLRVLMASIGEGADNQKQRMQETAAAMDQFNASVLDISRASVEMASAIETAKTQAVDSAAKANDAARAINGLGEVTDRLKSGMTALGEQARSIDRIVGVITDIADQTNLLALNAAIEAARAGDAGRGFAVVADEVRKLAEKTMVATKEVSQAIGGIQDAVLTNVNEMDAAAAAAASAALIATDTGARVDAILERAEHNAMTMATIAAASEEQSQSVTHVTSAVTSVTATASDMAEGIHDSERAMNELNSLAQELGLLMADFEAHLEVDTLVVWTSELNLDIPIIDAQHRMLLDLVNNLYAAMKSGQGQSVLKKLLGELAQYTVFHFDTEEDLFAKHKYPRQAEHVKIHTALKGQVVDYLGKLERGEATVSQDLLVFLKDWVVNHIAREDKKYAPHLRSCGLGPAKALAA